MKRVEDRGGTQTATKIEGTSVFPIPSRMVVNDLQSTMPPTQGVTVTGPGNYNPRVMPHSVAVYREGATITPAPLHGNAPQLHVSTAQLHSNAPQLHVSAPHLHVSAPQLQVSAPQLHVTTPQLHISVPQSHVVAPPAHGAQPNTLIHQITGKQGETISLPNTPASVFSRAIAVTGNTISVAVTSPSVHGMQIVQKNAHNAAVHTTVFGGNPATIRTVTPAQGLPTSGNTNFQRLKVEDALSYLDQVKFKFGNQPQVYNDFLDIMKEFKSQSIDTPGVISRVSMLFKGHPELIVGFNTFLPPGYKIEVQTNESQQTNLGGHAHLQSIFQTIVHTPHGSYMQGAQGMMGPAISTASTLPSRPLVAHQPTKYQNMFKVKSLNEMTPAVVVPPPPRTENLTAAIYAGPPVVAAPLPAPVSIMAAVPPLPVPPQQQQQQNPPSAPNSTAPQGGGGGPNQQPVEFNHAINYVNKIKNRFQGQQDVYKQFLEILHTYQKDQRTIKEGGAPKSLLTETEVYAQVSRLFQNQEDLLAEFGQFLPEATNDNSTEAIMVSSKGLANDHGPTAKRSTPKPSLLPAKSDRPAEQLKRPVAPGGRMQPPAKKPRLGVLKDVSLAEAGKYGTLNEYAFFDKVRKAIKNGEVYENFLRCLKLFNQEVVSRTELVQLVTPFLNKFPELLKWFKDFVGFKDGGGKEVGGGRDVGVPPPIAEPLPPQPMTQPRHERISGDAAMEIDYASCKRLGASYCALPKNFVQPKCTGRGVGSTLCREVLNDTWVSFPSWSEDSQFVSSRKTQYEENIYRTEDERFEFDVVLETNRDTIKVLECVQKKMSRMPPEEAARYRLEDSLGGTSPTIHQRAVRRIYGDKSSDIIEGLKRNPVVAVPLVLRRLKAKDQEWREVQKQYNKVWREQNERNYLKSLDHQGLIFKQNDVRTIRSKSLLNEIETIYDEAHEAEEQGGAPTPGPHITLEYKDQSMLEDATQLLIHHVKRQTSIHKRDKHKIKTLIRQNLPDILFQSRLDMSDEEEEEEDESEEVDDDEDKKEKKERGKVKDIEVNEEEIQDEVKENKTPPHIKGVSVDEEYNLLMTNNNWYIFFRLYCLLAERLGKMYEQAVIIAAEEGEAALDRKESTAAALRLKPKNGLAATDYYPAFFDMVKSVLDGNMDNLAYEDTLREMFGIHAFTAFTLDKVVSNAVRQLQHLVQEDSCQDCWDLYLQEKKAKGTGGPVSLAPDRYLNELTYQKKAEKLLTDENCFKILMFRESGKMTIELLDTDSTESRGVSDNDDEADTPDTILDTFLGMSISREAKNHLTKKPIFLRRSVRRYRKNTRHKIVPRPDATVKEESVTNPVPVAPTASRASRLGLEDSAILAEDPSSCSLGAPDLKVLWVVNSENYIYKRHSLNRAKKTHPDVCRHKHAKFDRWHSTWSSSHVTEASSSHHKEWMMGRVEGLAPHKTHRVTISDPTRTPYRTFTKFKAEMGKQPPAP